MPETGGGRVAAGGAVHLLPGKHAGLRAGRPWVYRGEIARVEGRPSSGDVVAVWDHRGGFAAWAFYHEASLLAARVLTTDPDERIDDAFLRRRLEAALAYRRRVLHPDEATACRLVFAEADGLPGLVVERLGDVLVLQALTAGIERRLTVVCDQLVELTGVPNVFERNAGPVRRLEGLPERVGPLRGHPQEAVVVREGRVRLEVDLRAGQKTGHFLDQRHNRLRFADLVRRLFSPAAREANPPTDEPAPAKDVRPHPGRRAPDTAQPTADGMPQGTPEAVPTGTVRVLDAFCHTGGFGLQALAAGASAALFVDSAAAALDGVRHNASLNRMAGWEALQGNAFDVLRSLERDRRRFEAVVLDPPAFARSRAQLDGAYRGYKEINLRAMRVLSPGGLLCTCSCSQAVSGDMFADLLRDAAADARRRLRIIERRGAAPDHPGLLGADETEYLKCFLLQAVD